MCEPQTYCTFTDSSYIIVDKISGIFPCKVLLWHNFLPIFHILYTCKNSFPFIFICKHTLNLVHKVNRKAGVMSVCLQSSPKLLHGFLLSSVSEVYTESLAADLIFGLLLSMSVKLQQLLHIRFQKAAKFSLIAENL